MKNLIIAVIALFIFFFIIACIGWLPKIGKDNLWPEGTTRAERVKDVWLNIGKAMLYASIYIFGGVIVSLIIA
jgi:hypothetical protein